MTHPYSIFIWQAPLGRDSEGRWEEPVQVSYEAYALYLAGLIHKDSRAVPSNRKPQAATATSFTCCCKA